MELLENGKDLTQMSTYPPAVDIGENKINGFHIFVIKNC